ncbi:hypothetical protein CVV38_02035 [Candidatus Peregrinibacteria bacterium HGW-Peregrinibacteria-1]|jgi:hypothetical protein|nr:MAG: hypothetical protein CVV38_02035 [Candidatus Peregrinibacteria bacterium HGW-Peregrinibacteria-1]
MRYSFKNKDGAILVEALIAIMVLAIASIVTANLIRSSVDGITYARNYMTASGILNETVEALTNMRNTSWLKYPSHPHCWSLANPYHQGAPNNCDSQSHIIKLKAAHSYALRYGADGKWEAKEVDVVGSGSLDLLNKPLHSDTVNKYQLWENTATGYWGHKDDSGTLPTPTGYYRSLEVLAFYPSAQNQQYATFKAKVQWKDGVKVMTLTEDFTFYNHLE